MTRGDLDKVQVFGRPIKPVALGTMFLMGVLTVFNVIGIGRLGNSPLSIVVALTALVSLVLLNVGWWKRSQLCAELGLLLATGVYISRSVFLALTVGLSDPAPGLSFGAALIIGGAYLLEVNDKIIQSRKGDSLWTRLWHRQ
jgi:hypothetical protein